MTYILSFYYTDIVHWIRNLQFCPGGARVVGQSPVWWPRQLQAWLEHAVHTNRSFGRMVRASTLSLWHSVRVSTSFGRMVLQTSTLLFWTCSAYKYVQFWTCSAYKYNMALACLQFTTLSSSWILSCIAEHGQCQSMAWLGVDTVIHSACAREMTEYSNSCLHMCLTSKCDKTDRNIEYTFTEISLVSLVLFISCTLHLLCLPCRIYIKPCTCCQIFCILIS